MSAFTANPSLAAHLVPRIVSPELCYSQLPSLTHSCASSSASSLHSIPKHTNEHLAILLPKALWKPDFLASRCDNFYCRVEFSVFERKHHCRKCGGVFCALCTSQTTGLLNTSNLTFLNPPRNFPLSTYESPESPILNSRICDDCWDQLHGNPSTPHTPDLIRPTILRLFSYPISMLKPHFSASPASGTPSPLSSPSDVRPRLASFDFPPPVPRRPRSLRTTPSVPILDGMRRSTAHASHRPLPGELKKCSYGEFDAYPLRHSSRLCKATGGGRWTPKHEPAMAGYRPPVLGAKASYELEMEQQELEEKRRRESPIIKDGEFQYRFPCQHDAPVTAIRSPFLTSTF